MKTDKNSNFVFNVLQVRPQLMWALLGGLFCWSLMGCQQSEPTHYVERKLSATSPNGPMVGGAGMGMMAGANAMTPGVSTGKLVELPFDYTTPKGWKELDPSQNKGMRARTFALADSLECTFILLGGLGGGLEQNLMRWAKQLDLNPSATDLSVFRSTAEVIQTSGSWKAELFDYRKFDQNAKTSTLAVILPLDNQTLFVKIQGKASALKNEESALLKLVQSIRPISSSKDAP